MPNYDTEGSFMSPSTEEQEQAPQEIEILEIAPNGLGYGEGSISVQEQLKNPEVSGLTPEALRIGGEIIKSGKPFLEVEADDDGCGDGRPTAVTYILDAVKGGFQKFKRSLRRAKVFGGGLVVASSMFRTVIKGNVQANETVLDDRVEVAGILDKAGIKYGGHTDDHDHTDDGKCGCGAIDSYPKITVNALKYRENITQTLRGAVYGDQFNDNAKAINAVYASYEDQVSNFDEYYKNAAGKKTMELMERRGSVIKQLRDEHLEDFLIINKVEGTTFDQRVFDEEMHARGVEGTAQAFAVDEWRGCMYADLIADLAAQRGMDRDFAYQMAYADFWIRTLATSPTLTAGDQPVYQRQERKNYALAS